MIDSSSCHIYTALWKAKKVILKLIKADRINSLVASSEFETEVSVLSRLNHGNIVRYLGSGFDPRRFIVLEYLEGGTLASVIGMYPGWCKSSLDILAMDNIAYICLLHNLIVIFLI